MSKKNKTLLAIFTESIGLYFSNFDKFVKYMTFPVLGQLLGLSIILTLSFFYANHLPNIITKIPEFNNLWLLITIAILITLPGFIIFIKAFWEYLVAYGAINSMLENMLKSGKVYDFDAHTELVKRRAASFICLWFFVSILGLLAIIPLLWIPCGVIAVFLVLIFQAYTFEPELSPLGCLRKSIELIKGHFASTFMLLTLAGALTYILIPQIANMFFEYTNITKYFANILMPIINLLPINEWNSILSYFYLPIIKNDDFALFLTSSIIAQIFIQYTLPLRSILWSMWYKELNGGKLYIIQDNKKSKKIIKKPSEKLMEASKKKYSSKKLDRNILKRAMEKDEDD